MPTEKQPKTYLSSGYDCKNKMFCYYLITMPGYWHSSLQTQVATCRFLGLKNHML